MSFLHAVTRILAFMGKEIVSTVRRPGILFSLIVGPFLIMALFGYGYSGFRHPLDTVVVVPRGGDLPSDPGFYADVGGAPVNIVEVTDDETAALERLARREVELVVIAPPDPGTRFREGHQEIIQVLYNEIDPITDAYVGVLSQQFASRVNQEIIAGAVREGEGYVGGDIENPIPPGVVAAPTRAELKNVSPTKPNVTDFFAPAVLALIIQHMGVTLTALSLVRERLGGAMELFRITPTGPLEILAGKYLAFGFLVLIVAGATVALITTALGVPVLATMAFIVAIVLILAFASLGLGLLISVIADSERQAVQLSLLVLLASVFFSGFVVPLRDFDPLVRGLAYALPVTHAIQLLQDAFLRGEWVPWHVGALALIGVVLFVLTERLLARSMRAV